MGGGTATLRALIREYLFVSLFRACAESLASENASRLAAMERADKNIDDLLEELNGAFHRLRQSGIDEELFDVISGFEALSHDATKPARPPMTAAIDAGAAAQLCVSQMWQAQKLRRHIDCGDGFYAADGLMIKFRRFTLF